MMKQRREERGKYCWVSVNLAISSAILTKCDKGNEGDESKHVDGTVFDDLSHISVTSKPHLDDTKNSMRRVTRLQKPILGQSAHILTKITGTYEEFEEPKHSHNTQDVRSGRHERSKYGERTTSVQGRAR